MTSVTVYCDEDVSGAVLRGLRRIGIDTVSAATAGKLGLSDEEQILEATSANRALLTHNIQDFPRLHQAFISSERHHAGIIVARQDLSTGETIRRVAHLSSALSADDMKDRLEYLTGW